MANKLVEVKNLKKHFTIIKNSGKLFHPDKSIKGCR